MHRAAGCGTKRGAMKRSLGALLAIGLAGLQLVAVLAVVFSSYLTSERALIHHARILLRDVGVNTIEHSRGFLSPAQGAAELAARLAENRVIASDNPALLEQLLFQQLQTAPQFAGAYYGGENGDFVHVLRMPQGPGVFRTKIITHDQGQRRVRLIWRNDDFSIAQTQEDPADRYDPRVRPWYIKAKFMRSTIWTDPYIFFTTQQPGITLAAPVLRDDRSVRGAVGVDIEISMISDFLSRLNIGSHGKALIVNHNGDVIAHPNKQLIKTQDDDGTLRFADITELDDPIARAAFGSLVAAGGMPVTEEKPSEFVYEGARYVSTALPVISDKLPWTIAVYAPEEDFTGVIKSNRIQNIWLAVLVSLLTAGVGLVLAEYIHRPVRAFATRAALIAQGEVDASVPIPRTFRELERANAALVDEIAARRIAEKEYGETFDMSSHGMAQLHPVTGRFLRVNARLTQITGHSAEALASLSFDDLLHPEDACLCPEPQSPDGALNHNMRMLRADGEVIWVSVSAIVIRDTAGRALYKVLTLDDVTQTKVNEQEIQRLNKDLSHLARGNTMGQMAAGLAHELNQPLTAIAQNADSAIFMLEREGGVDPELRDVVSEIEQQAIRAGDIIRALRGFIRKDEGARDSFDFAELLGQSLQLLRAEATEAGVLIQTEVPDGLGQIVGNRVQIAQVLVNLIRNAIEAMATDRHNQRLVSISARTKGPMLLVTVRDTGPGIDPNVALFSQFATTKPTGMGLGLSICRSIIEGHGGKLWNQADGVRGAVFHFTVPLAKSSSDAVLEPSIV